MKTWKGMRLVWLVVVISLGVHWFVFGHRPAIKSRAARIHSVRNSVPKAPNLTWSAIINTNVQPILIQ